MTRSERTAKNLRESLAIKPNNLDGGLSRRLIWRCYERPHRRQKGMALVRCVTEMGMGVDVHGLDYTNAAKRAVFDAIHHSSLGFPRLIGKTADDMRVDVTIGVPRPEAVDKQAVLDTLPHGGGHINVVHGGLQVLNEKGDDGWLIANAIIVVSIDDGK